MIQYSVIQFYKHLSRDDVHLFAVHLSLVPIICFPQLECFCFCFYSVLFCEQVNGVLFCFSLSLFYDQVMPFASRAFRNGVLAKDPISFATTVQIFNCYLKNDFFFGGGSVRDPIGARGILFGHDTIQIKPQLRMGPSENPRVVRTVEFIFRDGPWVRRTAPTHSTINETIDILSIHYILFIYEQ